MRIGCSDDAYIHAVADGLADRRDNAILQHAQQLGVHAPTPPAARLRGLNPSITIDAHAVRVDASNAGAVHLYERIGFRPVREDHAFEGTIR